MTLRRSFWFASFLLVAVGATHAQLDPALLGALKARAIGPATMSGRVAVIDAVANDPNVVWVGAASGGVWKSVDHGLTWKPVFDEQPVQSIGALAIFQASPDVVWVGTGEGSPRNSTSVGRGVYRTLDGGATWTHSGLERTERIARVLTHPSDPDTAYVAALGRAWGENEERGVFRTRDGGKTWERVLYVDERTGCAELVMDPTNPRKLIAAMWDYRRHPWSFRSGGPGSGIHVTWDGGETWKALGPSDGLPAGDLGRIGLAIAPSEPSRCYAYVEAKEENALYRSVDGGLTWKRTKAKENVGSRPFYYARLQVDPENPQRLYSLHSLVSVSDDGGDTFRVLVPFAEVHPDHHAMWIDPRDGRRLVVGNDGGIAFSNDRGERWRFARALPLAQFYHVRVDMETPFNVYGGLQDNGSWKGPSQVWQVGGIQSHHWQEVGFGDGFDTAPDPEDSMRGYAMSQEGHLMRWDLRTGERKNIRPAPPEGSDLRFNWNAAFAQDPFDPATIYFGSQVVHRSRDRGDTWERISADLTTNRPEWQQQAKSGGLTLDVTGAENYTTIVTLEPSPHAAGTLWAGTDDGRIHVTRDGGASWTSVEANLVGVPENTWVADLMVSRFDPDTVYAVLDDHRRSNWTPYVQVTRDFGTTWQSIANDAIDGYALCIEQDAKLPGILFLGTEFGLYVTLDDGQHWMKWSHGVPSAPIKDLVVHPRDHDLVVATHGRAAYLIDDVRPLRYLGEEITKRALFLFDPPNAIQHTVGRPAGARFGGHDTFQGENRPYGAMLSIWVGDDSLPMFDEPPVRHTEGKPVECEKLVVEILEGDAVVRRLEHTPCRGVNRVVWDLKRKAFASPRRGDDEEGERGGRGGPEVLAGKYRVRVSRAGEIVEGIVRVLPDPRCSIAEGDRRAKYEAVLEVGALQERAVAVLERLRATRERISAVEAERQRRALDKANRDDEHAKRTRALLEEVKALEARFVLPEATKGIPEDRTVLRQVGYAMGALTSSWDAPTAAQGAYVVRARTALREAIDAANVFYVDRIGPYRAELEALGLTLLPRSDPIDED